MRAKSSMTPASALTRRLARARITARVTAGRIDSGKGDSKKDRKSRRDGKDDNGGNDDNGSHGDDDYSGATSKCQSQYNDCLAANKQVSSSPSRCSSYNAGWS